MLLQIKRIKITFLYLFYLHPMPFPSNFPLSTRRFLFHKLTIVKKYKRLQSSISLYLQLGILQRFDSLLQQFDSL